MQHDPDLDGADVPGARPGPYAFVFWNDDLTDELVLGQLELIAGAGFRGVTLSARVGLSRRVGYLTPEHLRLVRLAVDECARLGLAVMLYDEASYPSGSANGAVVRRDPSYAARCLVRVVEDVVGPVGRFWRPSLGRSLDTRLLAVVCVPSVDGRACPDRATLLPANERGLVRLDLPDGRWRVHAVFDAPSGGTIRGAHADEDDGSASAPPAADLLNPAAVAAFLELTHDAYARALGDHLGTTVVAMFTDEPSLLGRLPRAGAVPYTPGFEDDVARAAGVPVAEILRRLPGLWDDDADTSDTSDTSDTPDAPGTPDGQEIASLYHRTLRERLGAVYYGAQARWCEQHGIALTGHPAEADDLSSALQLHWPGQDTVWRWVLPGDGSGLVGPESTAPKVAASAAHARGGSHAVAEVLGAYGWRLTLDEARWLLDWYLSRGVPTLVMHAFFLSVRGNRAYESEPDLGPHNSWWPHLPRLVTYASRIADLFAEGTHTASVAVLCDPDHAPSAGVAPLFEAQVDFFYVDPAQVDAGQVSDGRLHVGDQDYVVVVDATSGLELDAQVRDGLGAFASSGGLILAIGDLAAGLGLLTEHLRHHDGVLVEVGPPAPHLRVVALRSGPHATYVFFNEGETRVRASVRLAVLPADPCWYDPFDGTCQPVVSDGGLVELDLGRRQTLVLRPATGEDDGAAVRPVRPYLAVGRSVVLDDWRGTVESSLGDVQAWETGLGNWTDDPALRLFSGSYRFTTDVDLPGTVRDVRLDLGVVGDAATVVINGTTVGELLWRPYVLTVDAVHVRPGGNRIEVVVSNSAANLYEGAELPSGLIGPVTIEF